MANSEAQQAIEKYWQDSDATEIKELFLQGLRESGTVLHAAQLANINRRTAYLWRDLDPAFREAWNSVLEDCTDNVERSLYNQATSEKNVIATIFYLKNNRAKYKDHSQVNVLHVHSQIERYLDQDTQLDSQLDSQQVEHPALSAKEIIRDAIGLKRS